MPEWKGPVKQLDAFRYEIPRSYKPSMRTDGLLFVDEKMLPSVLQDNPPEQVAKEIRAVRELWESVMGGD